MKAFELTLPEFLAIARKTTRTPATIVALDRMQKRVIRATPEKLKEARK
jgi:hypothetical protein